MIDVKACPLCGSDRSQPFDRRSFKGWEVRNRRCTDCGLVYQSPSMGADELAAFYEGEYRALYQGSQGPGRKELILERGRAENLLFFLKDRIPTPRRHLDIGASSGALALRLQQHFGGQATGVEPGNAYREFAAASGLDVYPSLEAFAASEPQPFDLITMIHVLEHLPDPLAYLRDLRDRHLDPDGRLLIEVPNLYSHNAFEVAHLVSFSEHTLREMLRAAGFRIQTLQRHGQPRSVVLPLYLTVLAQPARVSLPEAAPVRPERAVAFKRRAGMIRRRLLERILPGLAWLPSP